MALEGNLQLFGLPEVFQMVAGQQKTGILTVQGEQDIIAISFLSGEVVAADALNQSVEEGLGQILVQHGMVGADRFAALAAEHHAGSARLVDLLIERGVLDRAQLLEALRLQTFQLLGQVLGWRQGEFKFYGGDEVSFEEGFIPLSVEEVLVRVAAETSGRWTPQIGDVLRRTANADEQLASQGAARFPEGMGPLNPLEETLLGLVDGRRSLSELAAECAAGAYKVRFAALRLVDGGLLAVSQAVSAPPLVAIEPELEVELPPVPPAPRMRIEGVDFDRLAGWAVVGVTLLAAVGLLVGVVRRPSGSHLLFGAPWLAELRASFAETQRDALYARIDRAARTYFLLEGRYPEGFAEPLALGLLTPGDDVDPLGQPLRWLAEEVHYSVVPLDADGRGLEDLGMAEAISGDFLLDPEFVRPASASDEVPLVLID